jgi:hypothetical protein
MAKAGDQKTCPRCGGTMTYKVAELVVDTHRPLPAGSHATVVAPLGN